MGLFGNMSSDGLEEKEDRVGGGSWARETDIYEMEIKVAYASKSAKGAQAVNIEYVDTDGKSYEETYWVSGQNGHNYYMVKDKEGKETGKKKALAGFDHVNDICLVTTDKPLADQDEFVEEKTVNVYDPEAKRKVPKSVPVITSLIGKKVYVAVYKRLENKSVKDSQGNYQPVADTRDTNTTEKIFHYPTKFTVREAQDSAENPVFFDTWIESHKGKVMDKRTIKDGAAGTAGRPGGNKNPPAAGGSGTSERTSLFGKK